MGINLGVQIRLKGDYLVVKETLERIGIANKTTKVIIPSCYIIFKNNKHYIMHFKELLALEGYRGEIETSDIERRNSIVTMLVNWNLIEIDEEPMEIYQEELKQKIFVLSHKEKKDYTINHKYQVDKL